MLFFYIVVFEMKAL